ncbi:cytochrome-c peroxidase [Chitinophaga sp. Ak27]|uniref:cytochrome-c peroxidase n=1 Tax=Chitinophaga sp. Ak27 TaxID=2726116 RepID=UPI00145E7CDA|nr:cytochrome c peroxidase [Chitinophaga sp. Ak27]NLU93449.1 c-type cytochrome [Chitinophaga sp. Ak27]
MNKLQWLIITGIVLFLFACSKSEQLAAIFEGFHQPAGFPAPAYKFANNPVTKEGFELGRKLFYEPRLSRNNTISCGFCHLQASAFTHHGHDVSHGIDDRLGSRNSPPIMNLAWNTTLMWDGGVFDLDLQPIAPITNPVEMDETMDNVLQKLRNTPPYPALFQRAFGSTDITTARMMKALSQFMVMLVSDQSKYDSVMRKEGSTFTDAEQQGYAIYRRHCSSCHQEPLFTDQSFRNNGLGAGPNNDRGRYDITLNPDDQYKFKVPSLRNLAYTAPYMHDGRFYTLPAVLRHYTSEVREMPTLDPLLKQGGHTGFSLTATEQEQLLAFLQTLNDKKFVSDARFSEEAP